MQQETNAVNKQEGITDSQSAEVFFRRFVVTHATSLRTIASYLKREELGGQDEQLTEIERDVYDSTKGQLSCTWAELNTIDIETFQSTPSHTNFNAVKWDAIHNTPESFLRGYSVPIRNLQSCLELLVLDQTPSCRLFLSGFPKDQKQKLARYFGQRRRGGPIFIQPPTIYVAILKEVGNLHYQFETLSEALLFNPLPWHLRKM